jgi:hypothetical protein
MKLCHRCGNEIHLLSELQRTDSCSNCLSDLKCCLNCRFFDPSVNNQCREPQAEWCPDKEKANFCEFFAFGETAGTPPGMGGAQHDRQRARSAFDSLFKK